MRGFHGGSEFKASASNAGDQGLIPGLRTSPGEGNGNPLQYSCLEWNMLSRLVITFLLRSKHVLISWLQLPSAVILEPEKMKSDTVSPSLRFLNVEL